MSKLDLLRQLYGDVLISKCCNGKLVVMYCGQSSYYNCKKCYKPCEAISVNSVVRKGSDDKN